ncbi:MAG: RNA ligase partner protein [Chloroflexi bacterium]|nr:RNA ligase partner protein [Chloroflexota bacterium]
MSTPSAIVVDTSVFVNPDTRHLLGESVDDAIRAFIQRTQQRGVRVYIPVSIFNELRHFASPETMALLRAHAIVRAPDLFALQVPAAVLHFFIRDVRQRIDRGLRVAEQAARAESSDETIRKLREKYREALRSGIVDSVEDLDVVLLAKEVNAAILSADMGIRNMAETLGIEVFSMSDFLLTLEQQKEDTP